MENDIFAFFISVLVKVILKSLKLEDYWYLEKFELELVKIWDFEELENLKIRELEILKIGARYLENLNYRGFKKCVL